MLYLWRKNTVIWKWQLKTSKEHGLKKIHLVSERLNNSPKSRTQRGSNGAGERSKEVRGWAQAFWHLNVGVPERQTFSNRGKKLSKKYFLIISPKESNTVSHGNTQLCLAPNRNLGPHLGNKIVKL